MLRNVVKLLWMPTLVLILLLVSVLNLESFLPEAASVDGNDPNNPDVGLSESGVINVTNTTNTNTTNTNTTNTNTTNTNTTNDSEIIMSGPETATAD
jgi:hypothetical protein